MLSESLDLSSVSYSEAARAVLAQAELEARRMRHEELQPEHVLLGLIRQTKGIVRKVFRSYGLNFSTIQREIRKYVGFGKDQVGEEVPYSSRLEKVLGYSYEVSRELGAESVGAGHLLLGLLGPDGGIAKLTLSNLDVDGGRVRLMVENPGSSRHEIVKEEQSRKRSDIRMDKKQRARARAKAMRKAGTRSGRKIGLDQDIIWVYENLGVGDTEEELESAPGLGALNLMEWVLADPTHRKEFYKAMVPRALAIREAKEKAEAEKAKNEEEGKEKDITLEEVERLLSSFTRERELAESGGV